MRAASYSISHLCWFFFFKIQLTNTGFLTEKQVVNIENISGTNFSLKPKNVKWSGFFLYFFIFATH